MTTSPNKAKQKLSLRKRLFVKKSPKVGCYVDTDSNDEFTQSSSSRPISPVDPFIAHSSHGADHLTESSGNQKCTEHLCNNTSQTYINDLSKEEEVHPKCCKTFFKKSRPKSLVEGQIKVDPTDSQTTNPKLNSIHNTNDQTNLYSKSNSEEIPKAVVKFPKTEDPRKYFEHSGSFEGLKPKGKLFVKRLSADHLISNEIKPLYQSSSPESDRSSSLDRKRR